LGRASHALEDFWTHSNFVEMAIGEARFNTGLAELEASDGLTTATFGAADQSHSIAHKVRGLADEIEAELPLLRHLHEHGELPSPEDVRAGDTAVPAHESEADETGRLGHAYRAAGHAGAFGAGFRDPALVGAGVGGAAMGGMHDLLGTDNPANSRAGNYARAGVGGLVGFGGGIIGGALSGAATGWLEGGSGAGQWMDEGGEPTVLGGLAAGGGAVLGTVTGFFSGAVGGGWGALNAHVEGDTSPTEGAISGVRSFGDSAVTSMALDLLLSDDGIGLLRSMADRLEHETRDTIVTADPGAGAARSHSMLAKDQPGHDDDTHDMLRTAKFELSHALAVAADRMIIGGVRPALTAASAGEASSLLDVVAARLDELVAPPSPAHPLWDLIQSHRERVESALTAHYQAEPTAQP
jgi:hypothetical protein